MNRLSLPLNLAPDGISLIMTGLALFMTLCSALYAQGYKVSTKRSSSALFWLGLWSFGVFAILTVLASDWFSLTVFMELSSIALFCMVLVEDRDTAFMYLLSQFAGAGFLLVGVAILFRDTGSVSLGPVPAPSLPFFILGLGIKAGLPGLHFWLPRTHSRAPTPASTLLSGFAVKIGIYGLIRLASPAMDGLFLTLGLTMALYGVIQALLQHDSKRLLAFSTISQLGFVLSALGSGTPGGIAAALFYSVAHGLFKGLLFCSAGILEKSYGSRDLRYLGRTAQDSPLTFILFLIGVMAIVGFPGTSGFIAKSFVKESLKEGHHSLAIWGLFLAGLGTTLYFCKMGYYGFLRGKFSPSSTPPKAFSPPDPRCHVAMTLLAAATLVLGIIPLIVPGSIPYHAGSWLTAKNLLPGLLPILVGVLLFSLFPGRFAPSHIDVPDLYDLLQKGNRPFEFATSLLQRGHNGKLRVYLTVLLAAAFLIFAFLL